MTDYIDVVRDFAARTRKNLEFVEQHEDDPEIEVYEVTQFINSMLGLLIFPQQEYMDSIPETPLADLEAKGWPQIKVIKGAHLSPTLRKLVRYLRNSIAHFNVKFIADDYTKTVTGLRVRNHQGGDRKKPVNWEAEFTLVELRKFVEKFVEMLQAGELGKKGP